MTKERATKKIRNVFDNRAGIYRITWKAFAGPGTFMAANEEQARKQAAYMFKERGEPLTVEWTPVQEPLGSVQIGGHPETLSQRIINHLVRQIDNHIRDEYGIPPRPEKEPALDHLWKGRTIIDAFQSLQREGIYCISRLLIDSLQNVEKERVLLNRRGGARPDLGQLHIAPLMRKLLALRGQWYRAGQGSEWGITYRQADSERTKTLQTRWEDWILIYTGEVQNAVDSLRPSNMSDVQSLRKALLRFDLDEQESKHYREKLEEARLWFNNKRHPEVPGDLDALFVEHRDNWRTWRTRLIEQLATVKPPQKALKGRLIYCWHEPGQPPFEWKGIIELDHRPELVPVPVSHETVQQHINTLAEGIAGISLSPLDGLQSSRFDVTNPYHIEQGNVFTKSSRDECRPEVVRWEFRKKLQNIWNGKDGFAFNDRKETARKFLDHHLNQGNDPLAFLEYLEYVPNEICDSSKLPVDLALINHNPPQIPIDLASFTIEWMKDKRNSLNDKARKEGDAGILSSDSLESEPELALIEIGLIHAYERLAGIKGKDIHSDNADGVALSYGYRAESSGETLCGHFNTFFHSEINRRQGNINTLTRRFKKIYPRLSDAAKKKAYIDADILGIELE